MTLIQAQERFIARVNGCHPGHIRRVHLAAWRELSAWAAAHGFNPRVVCVDADDMATLERNAED